jgi:hypothetical protein
MHTFEEVAELVAIGNPSTIKLPEQPLKFGVSLGSCMYISGAIIRLWHRENTHDTLDIDFSLGDSD